MNEMQKGVLTLIKSAIKEKSYPLPEGFSIEEAFDFILKHKIMMLAYDGAVRCGVSKNEPAMQKLFKIYISGMLKSEKQLAAVNKIYSAFNENGIDYLPLKGCNMKYLYPKPELRSMGDADILIKEEQYENLKVLVEKLGFSDEGEVCHHYVWNSEDLHLELHSEPMPENYKSFHCYYENGWNKAIKTETNKHVYSTEDEFIFVLTHFAKHYLEGGIGLRHITDIFVYLKAFPKMDFEYIEKEVSKMGILKFHKNILKTVDYYFYEGEIDEAVEIVSEYIFESGNWGNYNSHVFANGARNSIKDEKVKGSKLKFMIQAAFPPAGNIKGRYPILKKAPFLLPIIWPIRWVDAFIFRNKNFKKNIKKLEYMDDEKSEIYLEKFKKSGFDF